MHVVDSLAMFDRRHHYVTVDAAFCRLLGVESEQLIGQPASLQIGLDAYDEHIRPCVERALSGELTAALLLTTHATEGALRLIAVFYPCLGLDGRIDYALARLRDDSANNRSRLAAQRRRQRQVALHVVESALSVEAELEKIGALAVHELLEQTGCYAVTLQVSSREHVLPEEAVAAPQQIAAAVTANAQLKPGACVRIPLQTQGILLGELVLQLAEDGTLRDELRSFTDAVADLLTQALFRDSMRTQIQQYTTSLERIVAERTQEVTRRRHAAMGIHDVMGMLISNQPLPAILDHVVRQAENMLAADAVAILEAQGKDDDIAFAPLAIDDPYSNVTDADLEEVQPLIAKVARQRQPLIGHSTEWGDTHDGRYHTHLVVPMVAATDVVGVAVYFFLAEREFTGDQIETAVVLSEQIFVAVESNRLQVRAQEGAALKERERLASELHDAVTQSIYSLSLFAEAGRRLASIGKLERVQEYLELLGETAQQAMKQLRLLLYELRPDVLAQIGLLGALHQRLDVVERRAGIEAILDVAGPFRLPPAVEDGLYRISQEALNNALKHAAARVVNVRVRIHGRHRHAGSHRRRRRLHAGAGDNRAQRRHRAHARTRRCPQRGSCDRVGAGKGHACRRDGARAGDRQHREQRSAMAPSAIWSTKRGAILHRIQPLADY
jgi:signal transduction histidine kinase